MLGQARRLGVSAIDTGELDETNGETIRCYTDFMSEVRADKLERVHVWQVWRKAISTRHLCGPAGLPWWSCAFLNRDLGREQCVDDVINAYPRKHQERMTG